MQDLWCQLCRELAWLNFMKTPRLILSFIGGAVFLLCITPAIRADKEPRFFRTPAQQKQENRNANRFGQLWLARRTRKIAPELLQMLAVESNTGLRVAIIKALGRLEDPQAIKPLRALGQRLAVGRIEARRLHGRRKLDAIARSIGTTWPALQIEAKRLRLRLQNRMGSYQAQEDPQRFVLEEFYDILYVMGKRGENIEKLGAFDLMIWSNDSSNTAAGLRSPEQAKLFAASLSNPAEIEFWLRRSLPPSALHFSPAHLLDLGPQVPQALKKYLKIYLRQAKSNPQKFARTSSYTDLFETVAATGDSHFVPLLKEFLSVNDRWVKISAADTISSLQKHRGLELIKFP